MIPVYRSQYLSLTVPSQTVGTCLSKENPFQFYEEVTLIVSVPRRENFKEHRSFICLRSHYDVTSDLWKED